MARTASTPEDGLDRYSTGLDGELAMVVAKGAFHQPGDQMGAGPGVDLGAKVKLPSLATAAL